MNQRNFKQAGDAELYTSAINCLQRTVRTEGVRALFKGLVPTTARMTPWNIIFFVSYEQAKILMESVVGTDT